MFNLIVKVKVDNDRIDEFESSMNTLIKEQNNGSTHSGKLYRSTAEQDVFYYQEEWENRSQLDEHVNSENFRWLNEG